MLWRSLVLAAVLLAAPTSHAQPVATPVLVRDLNTTPTAESSSDPSPFRPVGDRAVFFARSDGAARDLHGTDGIEVERLMEAVPNNFDATFPDFFPFQSAAGPRLLFTVSTGSPPQDTRFRRELWITDGTPAGTIKLKDAEPSALITQRHIRSVTDVGGGIALFESWSLSTGFELWRTDGTPAGTGLVRDIAPGAASSSPGGFLRAGAAIYFYAAGDGVSDVELWRTDGAIASVQTVPVRDIVAGASGSFPLPLTALGGTLLFYASTPAAGLELWRTDGTVLGTTIVKDIAPGSGGSSLTLLTTLGNRIILRASDPLRGQELWSSDGTDAGTQPLADINPGTASSSPFFLAQVTTPAGPIGYFTATQAATGVELWRTDGTPGGTRIVADLSTNPPSSGTAIAWARALPDGRLLFPARRGLFGGTPLPHALYLANPSGTLTLLTEHPDARDVRLFPEPLGANHLFALEVGPTNAPAIQIWKTDLTPAGTGAVATLPGLGSVTATEILQPHASPPAAVVMTTAYRPAGSGLAPATRRVFTIDPAAGTATEILPAGASASPLIDDSAIPLRVGQRLFTSGFDFRGREPWITDGTIAGTRLLANLRPDANQSSEFSVFTRLGSRLLVSISPLLSSDRTLYATDGTDTGTRALLTNYTNSERPVVLSPARAVVREDSEIVVTDGTPGGTGPLFPPDHPERPPSAGAPVGPVFGGRFVFTADDPLGRSDLWISDGTLAGTRPIGNLLTVGDVSGIGYLTIVGAGAAQRVYFVFTTNAANGSIFSTDGLSITQHTNTPGGPATTRPYELLALGDRLVFRDDFPATTGEELFIFDPASPASLLALDVANPGPQSSSPTPQGVFRDWLVFEASDAAFNRGSYVTNGRLANTYLVDVDPGPDSPVIHPRTFWDNHIIFTAETATLGPEAYALQPVDHVITLLGEIDPGNPPSGSTTFLPLAETDHGLLGLAGSASRGEELWITDNTTAGTRPLADILPGPESSRPSIVAIDGPSRIYFTADAGAAGGGPGLYRTDGLTVTRLADSPVLAAQLTDHPPRAGSLAVFPGLDSLRGRELWAWRIPGCAADFDRSGDVTVDDIFGFLHAYFALDPAADADSSGGVSLQDLFTFLVAYFQPCP